MIYLTAAMTLGPRIVFSFISAAVVPGSPAQHSPPSFWSPLSRFLLRKPTFFLILFIVFWRASVSSSGGGPGLILGQRHRDWFGLTCDASEAGRISLQTFSGIIGGECPHLASLPTFKEVLLTPQNIRLQLLVGNWTPNADYVSTNEALAEKQQSQEKEKYPESCIRLCPNDVMYFSVTWIMFNQVSANLRWRNTN